MPKSSPLWPHQFPFPQSLEEPLSQVGPGKDPNDDPHRCQSRAQAGEPDPGRGAEVEPFVEADRLGVHKEQVSLSERLDFMGSGVTDRQADDTCSQDQETQGQGHLDGERGEKIEFLSVPICASQGYFSICVPLYSALFTSY